MSKQSDWRVVRVTCVTNGEVADSCATHLTDSMVAATMAAVAALDRMAATSLEDDRERRPLPREPPVARLDHEVGIAAVVLLDRVADAAHRAARRPYLRAS